MKHPWSARCLLALLALPLASCTGQPCTYFSSPTAWEVPVTWLEANLADRTERSGQGMTAHRVGSGDTDSKSDWAVGGHSLGRPNP